MSGYSGAGRAGIDLYEKPGSAARPAFQVYGLGLAHKHVPEIQYHAGLSQRPFFLPAYGAFRQGIVLTIPLQLRLLPSGVNAKRLHESLLRHYEESLHVQVMSPEWAAATTHLDPEAFNDSIELLRAGVANEADGQVLLTAVFDNLGKGGSGAGRQNLELMRQAL